MKRNIVLSAIILFACSSFSYGQGEIDAYRASRNELTGTARSIGMGGAFGALGGDVGGIAINPAGIGVYRSSEVVGSMDFTNTNIKTNWIGTTNSDNKFKFNFDNLSYIGYYPLGDDNVPSINFGFSFNRLKNFDRQYTASGRGMSSSLTDFIARTSDGINSSDLGKDYPYEDQSLPWLSVLGWNGYLINNKPNSSTLYDGLFPGTPGSQDGIAPDPRLTVYEKGHIDSYDFSLGTSVAEKLYLGFSFSLTDIDYTMESTYSEDFSTNGGYGLHNYLHTNGSGYQLSVGAIYRPIDVLRVGVSYHSPTWYALTDSYYGTVNTDYTKDGERTKAYATTPMDPIAATDYKFRNPYRWTFSAAGIIGTKAIVSVDYEIADYRGMDYEDPNGFSGVYSDANSAINEDYRLASTVRAGIEYRATPRLSIRAGYAWMQSPYQKYVKDGNQGILIAGTIPHYTLEGDASNITCGLGYKITRNLYVDAAFVYRTQVDDLYYFPKYYVKGEVDPLVDSTPAKFANKGYKGVLTMGYKF